MQSQTPTWSCITTCFRDGLFSLANLDQPNTINTAVTTVKHTVFTKIKVSHIAVDTCSLSSNMRCVPVVLYNIAPTGGNLLL